MGWALLIIDLQVALVAFAPDGAEVVERIDHLLICGMQTEYCVDTTTRRAVLDGYRVTLVADGHTTPDNEVLPADTIRRHHNVTLRGFGAGVSLAPAAEIDFTG
jgi:nicotinamidase-related amidase